jgi:hypothetical protein
MSAYYPDDAQLKSDLQKYQEAEIGLVPYNGPIEHSSLQKKWLIH